MTNILILWDNIFGKNNDINTDLLNLLTGDLKDNDDIDFIDLNYITRLFPNIEQIEYSKGSLNKKQIMNLVNSILRKMESMNHNVGIELKYIIIHHEYSSIKNESNESLFKSMAISSATAEPLISINTRNKYNGNLNNHWTANYERNKVIICKSNDWVNIVDVQFKFNDIKQGYTSLKILHNFE